MSKLDNYRKTFKSNTLFNIKKPLKTLRKILKKNSGRNNQGKITSRFRGKGHKKILRNMKSILFCKSKVKTIEYDPTRSSFIMGQVDLKTGKKFYTLHTSGVKVNEVLTSCNWNTRFKNGDTFFLKTLPVGSIIHSITNLKSMNIEYSRSAGTTCKILTKDEELNTAVIKLPSKQIKTISLNCLGTLGLLSNQQFYNRSLIKAGRSRWLGRRPRVRGVAMNPVDHPHGGGEGKSYVGRPSVTKWGLLTKGIPTSRKQK